jgi:RNA polymerase sigma-70 factor (ECF subfamily)
MASTTPITRLLTEWAGGSALALEQLTPLVYAELRSLAAGYLRRESPGHILQPTALVHEAYLRLVDQHQQNWESRHHFYGVAAHLMRLILVDSARRARADKRGGGVEHTVLKDIPIAGAERLDDLLALDEAMTALEALDPRKVKIIELRYFGGMTVEETAKTIGASTATVERDTRIAQLWLSRHLTGGPA